MYGKAETNMDVPKESTLSNNTVMRLQSSNEYANKQLSEIEDMLHRVYYQRGNSEKVKVDNGTVPIQSDFFTSINSEIDKSNEVNDRISKIVSHLRLII